MNIKKKNLFEKKLNKKIIKEFICNIIYSKRIQMVFFKTNKKYR